MRTLNKLALEYNKAINSPDVNDPIFCCKLATLEYCGWVEESFDDIARRAAKGKLKTQPYLDMLSSEIKNTHGFSFKKHLRPMLSRIIGLVKMEMIENELSQGNTFIMFLNELDTIKRHRDEAAHKWVKDTTAQYPSPSEVIRSLEIVYPVTKKMYSCVCGKL